MMPKESVEGGLLKLLADSLPGLVNYIDRDGHYRFLNARYRDWIGIEPADFIGKTPRDLGGAETYARLAPSFEKAFAGEVAIVESTVLMVDGVERHLRTQMVPHIAGDGEVLGIIMLTIDLTDEKKAEAALAQARDRAIDTAGKRSRFLAAASHDLRQPLHALTLFARALSRRVVTAETRELVAHMEAALGSLRDMFNALLDMSKLDAGLIEPHIATVPVRKLLKDLEAGFAIDAKERGLIFRVHPLDVAVTTDHSLIETMLRNLIANALKFTKTGGVLVGCRLRGGRLRIEVYDTGPGIAEDRFATIFDEFQRASVQARGENEGLGLGLAIVHHLADLLGMTVDIRSTRGHGSRFAIEMPLAPDPRPGAATAMPDVDDDPSSLVGLRVLVLDDDPAILLALSHELSDHGASVVTASNRADIMVLAETVAGFDAAIIDYDLAMDTGPDLLAELNHRLGIKIPAVVMTGSTDPDALASLRRSGHRWMIKPVDPDRLIDAIRSVQSGDPT